MPNPARNRRKPSGSPAQPQGLENEIEMLRKAVRRLFDLAIQAEDPEEAVRALRAMSSAAGRVAALLKTQSELGRGDDEHTAALDAALQQIMRELDITAPYVPGSAPAELEAAGEQKGRQP